MLFESTFGLVLLAVFLNQLGWSGLFSQFMNFFSGAFGITPSITSVVNSVAIIINLFIIGWVGTWTGKAGPVPVASAGIGLRVALALPLAAVGWAFGGASGAMPHYRRYSLSALAALWDIAEGRALGWADEIAADTALLEMVDDEWRLHQQAWFYAVGLFDELSTVQQQQARGWLARDDGQISPPEIRGVEVHCRGRDPHRGRLALHPVSAPSAGDQTRLALALGRSGAYSHFRVGRQYLPGKAPLPGIGRSSVHQLHQVDHIWGMHPVFPILDRLMGG